jgi:CBS domain containing-hemolysin-like protein
MVFPFFVIFPSATSRSDLLFVVKTLCVLITSRFYSLLLFFSRPLYFLYLLFWPMNRLVNHCTNYAVFEVNPTKIKFEEFRLKLGRTTPLHIFQGTIYTKSSYLILKRYRSLGST